MSAESADTAGLARAAARAEPTAGSFRDPAGFVFTRDGTVYRQVNASHGREFDAFAGSTAHAALVERSLLLPHEPAPLELAAAPGAHRVIRPDQLRFVSYPYEWCFGQLRDAALLTLDVQALALSHGYTLKDASAYNVQFHRGRAVFIDTLSFEPYAPGRPWVAYRQFCEHFFVPLLLASTRDAGCSHLLRHYLDGIPLELGAALLPWRTRARLGPLLHVHAHARAKRRYARASVDTVLHGRGMSLAQLSAMVQHLRESVAALAWRAGGTTWAGYADDNGYVDAADASKRRLVDALVARAGGGVVWDAGANTGEYSRVARRHAGFVLALDADPAAGELHWRRVRADGEDAVLPLLVDLANPSPAQGWAHTERMSLEQRGPADVLLALALVHHLAIGNNVPLDRVAHYFARLGRHLVVEFVPKHDPQVARLLRNRADVFPGYTPDGFERAFRAHFDVVSRHPIVDSDRTLFLMRRRAGAA